MTKADFCKLLGQKLDIPAYQAAKFYEGAAELMSDILRDGEDVRIPGVGTLLLTDYRIGNYLDRVEGAHRRWHHGPFSRCDICKKRKPRKQRLRAVKFKPSSLLRAKIYGVSD